MTHFNILPGPKMPFLAVDLEYLKCKVLHDSFENKYHRLTLKNIHHGFLQGMQPQNRLRSGASSVICSRCTSMLSMNHSRMTSRYTSQASLSHMPSHKKAPPTKDTNMPKPESEVEPPILCKICLIDCPVKETYRIQQCKCIFCTEVRSN